MSVIRHKVVCQKWEESERGWGTRPDGYSLHLTEADRQAYIKAHVEWMKATYGNEAPHEYDRPSGTPYEMEIDTKTFAKVEAAKAKHGLRCSGQPPGDEGPDGWRTVKS